MGRLLAIAALLFVQQANPDLKYEKDAGVSIMKPPKNDEWEFKDKGFFNSRIFLAHKVDEHMVEIYFQAPANSGFTVTVFDAKKIAEDEWTKLSSNPDVKDASKKDMKQTKLGGNNAWLLQTTFKRAEKALEMRQYIFVARENQCLYMVAVWGEEGMYKKHQKLTDFILSTVKTWKLPK